MNNKELIKPVKFISTKNQKRNSEFSYI